MESDRDFCSWALQKLNAELSMAGGMKPLSELCEHLQLCATREGWATGISREMLSYKVLAAIPMEYTSRKDGLLRLPPEIDDVALLKAWSGWKVAMDEELFKAGGELPWREVAWACVMRYYQLMGTRLSRRDEELVGACALRMVPQSYTSADSENIRIPDDTSKDEVWPGHQIEIIYSVDGKNTPYLGWITGQVGEYIKVTFDECWSVEVLKLPEAWRYETPAVVKQHPTRRFGILCSGIRSCTKYAKDMFTEEMDATLEHLASQVTDNFHHWRWIACTLGLFVPGAKLDKNVVYKRWRSLCYSKTSSPPDGLPTLVRRAQVIETLHSFGHGATSKEICEHFKQLYPNCCDGRKASSEKTITIWQTAVHNVLLHHNGTVFVANKRNRKCVWSLNQSVQWAIAADQLNIFLRKPRKPEAKQFRRNVRNQVAKVRAHGVAAGRLLASKLSNSDFSQSLSGHQKRFRA
ncbi:unnamed protein product [Polarella glacialis]|uniref:Uncharacterized protein n=1 Tax=Polarella glacialis TaxID=89957 RepID=A0A813FFV8_POLGL|nr:unnamed protein product [Polarella glacialis]